MHLPLEAKLGLGVTAVPPEEEIDNPSGLLKLKEERKKKKELIVSMLYAKVCGQGRNTGSELVWGQLSSPRSSSLGLKTLFTSNSFIILNYFYLNYIYQVTILEIKTEKKFLNSPTR